VGLGALPSSSTGTNNTGVGYNALSANTSGSLNTAVGWSALVLNTVAVEQTAVGWQALYNSTTGGQNTAVGYNAMVDNQMGSTNTAIGGQALASNQTTNSNTAVGWEALYYAKAANNTALGYQAGMFISGGSTPNFSSGDSLYVGYEAYPLASGDTNETVLGNSATGAGSNTAVIGNSSVTDVYAGSSGANAVLHSKGLQLANAYNMATLPACGAATLLERLAVSDATVAVPGSAYTGGGTYTIAVECTFNSAGSIYTWIID
jgi:hypothetical protein